MSSHVSAGHEVGTTLSGREGIPIRNLLGIRRCSGDIDLSRHSHPIIDRLIYPSQQFVVSSILPRTYAAILFRQSRLYTVVRGLSISPGRCGFQVDSALQSGFPIPSSAALVSPRSDPVSARRAANTRITIVVKRIVRQSPPFDVIPHLRARPGRQRIDFHQLPLSVPFNNAD